MRMQRGQAKRAIETTNDPLSLLSATSRSAPRQSQRTPAENTTPSAIESAPTTPPPPAQWHGGRHGRRVAPPIPIRAPGKTHAPTNHAVHFPGAGLGQPVANGGDKARRLRAARPLHRPARGPVRGGSGGHRRARRGDGAEKGAWIWILRRCAAVCSAGSSATAIPLPSMSGWRIIRTGCLRWSRRTSAPFYRKGPSTG